MLRLTSALHNMGAHPPHDRASRAEAVGALEAALGAHTFMVMGEVRLSA